ncbi:uncharacterized protein BYT42DRAFT_553858 [Radiomyces spectabilis]|uniref:uncharacterized protein n=1 Tax=Radiomyces spectabilis TaxID=64574 RepID=UPI00221EEEF4|nr:uncharacterized protein BYT42DRAFT_553858 [Radiomyces spectabilis]KAI8394250.1 hypothetical protein BYT42DRAFT_553858 [Radiomyces spectabilis]
MIFYWILKKTLFCSALCLQFPAHIFRRTLQKSSFVKVVHHNLKMTKKVDIEKDLPFMV